MGSLVPDCEDSSRGRIWKQDEMARFSATIPLLPNGPYNFPFFSFRANYCLLSTKYTVNWHCEADILELKSPGVIASVHVGSVDDYIITFSV